MSTTAFNRIVDEFTVHPKERLGFKKSDFELLQGDEKKLILERVLKEVEDGWGYSDQLKWILGDSYVPFLERRLASLRPKSHGLVFLPYFIYKETKNPYYIVKMMREILVAEDGWDQREAAIGGYLRELVGSEPIFFDFCRHVILYVRDISMKEDAMLWLAYETGYPLEGLELSDELSACVHELQKSNGTDPAARAMLDIVHADTGHFSTLVPLAP